MSINIDEQLVPVSAYPEEIFFPEEVTLFGTISFDFDDAGSFIVSFSHESRAYERSFFEGAININTTPETFDVDMAKLLDSIHQLRMTNYKSGAELQLLIIDQLRLDFPNFTVDDFLQQSLLQLKEA